jgi:hypothetical protein
MARNSVAKKAVQSAAVRGSRLVGLRAALMDATSVAG